MASFDLVWSLYEVHPRRLAASQTTNRSPLHVGTRLLTEQTVTTHFTSVRKTCRIANCFVCSRQRLGLRLLVACTSSNYLPVCGASVQSLFSLLPTPCSAVSQYLGFCLCIYQDLILRTDQLPSLLHSSRKSTKATYCMYLPHNQLPHARYSSAKGSAQTGTGMQL